MISKEQMNEWRKIFAGSVEVNEMLSEIQRLQGIITDRKYIALSDASDEQLLDEVRERMTRE